MVLPLTYLKSGEEGRVVWIASDLPMRRRLADQGIIPGASLICVLKPTRRGMSAYRIHGSVIALRRETVGEIFIEL